MGLIDILVLARRTCQFEHFANLKKAKMPNKKSNNKKLTPNENLIVAINVTSELEVMMLAEQVYRDYSDILKSSVIPDITKAFGLKLREVRVLDCAAKLKGHVSAANIAEHLRQDPATITRSMVSLIGLGFVTTSESFEDGRSRVINLTEKGNEVVELYNTLLRTALRQATTINDTFMSVDNLASMQSVMSRLAKRVSFISRRLRTLNKGNR